MRSESEKIPVAELGLHPVSMVVDGKTLKLERDGLDVVVRLLRIEVPEPGRKGFAEARSALEGLIAGQKVRLMYEGYRKDPGGRELAYVFAGSKNLNVEMVRSGWARFSTRSGESRLRNAFTKAEGEAREAKRGLWGGP